MKCVYFLGVVTCVSNTKASNAIVEDRAAAVKSPVGDVGMREHGPSQHAFESLAQLETSAGSGEYQFTGIPRDPAKNFCRAVVSSLHDKDELVDGKRKYGHKTNVTACDDPTLTETQCPDSYVKGSRGIFYSCKWTGTECAQGYEHHCTWTYLMEDLVHRQTSHTSACHGHMLEAKRSLDGLLYDAESILRRIRIQNERIYAQNVTIRDLLNDQRTYWAAYMLAQDQCWGDADGKKSEIQAFDGELDQLWGLVEVIRSDVDFNRDNTYDTQNTKIDDNTSQYGGNRHDLDMGGDDKTLSETDNDERGRDRNTHPDGGDRRITHPPTPAPSEVWDAGDPNFTATPSSLVEMEAASCAKFKDLVKKYESKAHVIQDPIQDVHDQYGVQWSADKKYIEGGFEALNCHEERQYLQDLVNKTTIFIRKLKSDKRKEIAESYSECMSEATYVYKFAVESRDCSTGPCVDRRIQLAALEIHDAQNVISTWEPRLHDVEQAAARLRSYLVQLNTTCVLDEKVNGELRKVEEKIRELAECPGRNDFRLTVPHWVNPPQTTPSPTPWYERWSPDDPNPDHGNHVTEGKRFGNRDLDEQITAPVRPKEHQTLPDVTTYT